MMTLSKGTVVFEEQERALHSSCNYLINLDFNSDYQFIKIKYLLVRSYSVRYCTNTWKVLKYGAGEEWKRSVGPIM